MKIFLSSDMEGTAGVVDWNQCLAGNPEYEYYRGLLQNEVNAAIVGAQSAGATEFVLNDSHSGMQNMRPDKLAGNARYISGKLKPMYMMQGLDSTFDAVFFISYHGSMSSDGAVLSHTYNPRAIADVWLNGEVVSEGGLNALVAQYYNVPIALVTGDDITEVETKVWSPEVKAAVVKTSINRYAANSMHPVAACELIQAKAAEAIKDLAKISVPKIKLPATIRIRYHNSDWTNQALWLDGIKKIDAKTVELTDSDPLRLFQRFITAVFLSRTIVDTH